MSTVAEPLPARLNPPHQALSSVLNSRAVRCIATRQPYTEYESSALVYVTVDGGGIGCAKSAVIGPMLQRRSRAQ